MWYFVRLGLFAVEWEHRHKPDALGTLFREYYMLEAASYQSALNKAERILSLSENTTGTGELNGKKVSLIKLGILDIEPITSNLVSGCDIFDESEENVPFSKTKNLVLSEKQLADRINYEKDKGFPPVLEVYFGDDFDKL